MFINKINLKIPLKDKHLLGKLEQLNKTKSLGQGNALILTTLGQHFKKTDCFPRFYLLLAKTVQVPPTFSEYRCYGPRLILAVSVYEKPSLFLFIFVIKIYFESGGSFLRARTLVVM